MTDLSAAFKEECTARHVEPNQRVLDCIELGDAICVAGRRDGPAMSTPEMAALAKALSAHPALANRLVLTHHEIGDEALDARCTTC